MPPPNRQPYRPTPKEVGKKVRGAISALENGDYDIIDETRTAQTFEALDVNTMDDVLEKVLVFLDEILDLGPWDSYCGIRGLVEFCDKPGFNDVRLFAFAWYSETMTRRMYLKFGLRGKSPVFSYMHLSCHDDES